MHSFNPHAVKLKVVPFPEKHTIRGTCTARLPSKENNCSATEYLSFMVWDAWHSHSDISVASVYAAASERLEK